MTTRREFRDRINALMVNAAFEKWDQPTMDAAINMAIGDAWPSWFVNMTDSTTVTTATDTFTHSLPSDCEMVLGVFLEQGSNEPYTRLYNVRVRRSTSSGTVTHTIYLDNANSYDSSKAVRIHYVAKLAELTDDTTESTAPYGWVVPKAQAYLYMQSMNRAPHHSVDAYKALWSMAQQMAEDFRMRSQMQFPPQLVFYEAEGGGDILAQPDIIDKVRG